MPTQAHIASGLGLSPGYVSMLVKRGMPVDSVESADAWRRKTFNPAHGKTKMPLDDVDIDAETLMEARTRRERAAADTAELELAELRSVLIRRASVIRAEERKANAVREAILQIPAQLAPVLAAESSIVRCQDILSDAMMGVLGQISGVG